MCAASKYLDRFLLPAAALWIYFPSLSSCFFFSLDSLNGEMNHGFEMSSPKMWNNYCYIHIQQIVCRQSQTKCEIYVYSIIHTHTSVYAFKFDFCMLCTHSKHILNGSIKLFICARYKTDKRTCHSIGTDTVRAMCRVSFKADMLHFSFYLSLHSRYISVDLSKSYPTFWWEKVKVYN